jgi:hypothetical protein
MRCVEKCGYRFSWEHELGEAEQWLREYQEIMPSTEEVLVETAGLIGWRFARRDMLARWFADWADTDGQTLDRVSERDAVRKRLVEGAGLTADEREIIDALMDEWPRQEIMEYYNLERGQLPRIEAVIERKIHKARS